MDSLIQKTPDLKWERLGRVGRGKAAVVWRVRNTVTKEIQSWKWTHSHGDDGSGESTVLDLLQGHGNIQKALHWNDLSDVLVLKFANGGDMHTYVLDHFGSTRQRVPGIFIWHSLRSMAAALAYCQAGWKDGDPFVVKKGWRPIIHQDIVEGNILLHWHKSEPLPRLILSDFGDAIFLDKMPPLQYDYRLRMMRARDPTASHLKRDIQRLGSILQSMLVVHLFGGNAEKMQQDHNVALAFKFVREQGERAFSRELTELVDKLAHN
jgi:serine/threonine protein kinase